MKIVGTTTGGYLVEASEAELALAAGYRSTYDEAWKKLWAPWSSGSRSTIPSGTMIDVTLLHSFIREVEDREETARKAAKTLEALAQLITTNLPRTIIVPTPEEPAHDATSGAS